MKKESIFAGLFYLIVIAVVVAIPVYYWQVLREGPDTDSAAAKAKALEQIFSKDGYDIYLTAKERNGVPLKEPTTAFSCGDRIFGVIEINRPDDSASHVLSAVWRNPRGDDQEQTKYPFQLAQGNARLWVWLKLHRSAEAAAVKFLNPSAGMEEFVGEWELHISVDEKTITKKKFQVIC